MEQKTLSPSQLSEFYIDVFVSDQVRDFRDLLSIPDSVIKGTIVDIGGGVGYFASAVRSDLFNTVRVIEMDPVSVEHCKSKGLEAEVGDATNCNPKGDESVVCFNLILHHLVANSDHETRALQAKAIRSWKGSSRKLFVNEYIYESYIQGLSGWLIYKITGNRMLSAIGRLVSKIIPSLRANTFGVGVRFRSHNEWQRLFIEEGFRVIRVIKGANEQVALPRRLLLIKNIRRDSFLLEASN